MGNSVGTKAINYSSTQDSKSSPEKRNPKTVTSERSLRALVLDEEIPYPPNAGKRVRTWNLLRRLAERHSVHLLCYGSASDPAAAAVQRAGISLSVVEPQPALTGWRLYLRLLVNLFSPYPFSVTKHYSFRFQKELKTLLENESWDLIQCEWTPYARFVPLATHVPVLVVTHNVESQIWTRRAHHARNVIAKVFFRTQAWKMKRFERRALRQASAVTAVTANDVDTIRNWGVGSIRLVPNGVDLQAYNPACDDEHENEILFLGSLDWFPNVDSLHYFVNAIFPLVRARNVEARLRIAGRKPSEALKKMFSGIEGVDFVGEVEDVRRLLDRASVVIVPLRIGGGSRLKILEALAAGKAVVSTTIGAEGLDVVSREHLMIADSPREFAGQVDELLGSRDARLRLGSQGRKFVEERYGWDGLAERLERAWYDICRTTSHEDQVMP